MNMNAKWVRTAVLAVGLVTAVGLPTLACSGMEMSAGGIESGILGTFKVQPSEDTLRELLILDAAVNGKPPPKKVQPLSASDKELYKSAKGASGAEKAAIAMQLKLMKGARITFESGGAGRYTFDGGENPFDWSLSGVNGDEGTLELKYDHGAVEKGTIEMDGKNLKVHWTSPREMDLVFKG